MRKIRGRTKGKRGDITVEVTMRSKLLILAPVLGALFLSLGSSATANHYVASSAAYRLDEVQWVWLKADLDADGRLTREEVWEEDAALAARFDDADLDGDGTLSAGEFEVLLMSA